MKVRINSIVWYKNRPLSVGEEVDIDESHLDFFTKRGDTVISEIAVEVKPQPVYETKVILPNKKGKKK